MEKDQTLRRVVIAARATNLSDKYLLAGTQGIWFCCNGEDLNIPSDDSLIRQNVTRFWRFPGEDTMAAVNRICYAIEDHHNEYSRRDCYRELVLLRDFPVALTPDTMSDLQLSIASESDEVVQYDRAPKRESASFKESG